MEPTSVYGMPPVRRRKNTPAEAERFLANGLAANARADDRAAKLEALRKQINSARPSMQRQIDTAKDELAKRPKQKRPAFAGRMIGREETSVPPMPLGNQEDGGRGATTPRMRSRYSGAY